MDPGFQEHEEVPASGPAYRRFVPRWWTPTDAAHVCSTVSPPWDEEGVLMGYSEWEFSLSGVENWTQTNTLAEISREIIRIDDPEEGVEVDVIYEVERINTDNPQYGVSVSHGNELITDAPSAFPSGSQDVLTEQQISLPLDPDGGVITVTFQGQDVMIRNVRVKLMTRILIEPQLLAVGEVNTLRVGDDDASPIEAEGDADVWPRVQEPGAIRTETLLADQVDVEGAVYRHPAIWAGARALGRQPRALQQVETRVDGLHGPATQLRWPARAAAWTASSTDTLPVGRVLHLLEGRTTITDIERP
jgi:hypothetical protein